MPVMTIFVIIYTKNNIYVCSYDNQIAFALTLKINDVCSSEKLDTASGSGGASNVLYLGQKCFSKA